MKPTAFKYSMPLMLFFLCLVSCTTRNLFQVNKLAEVDSVFFEKETHQYQIRKDDKISISIWNHDDLSVGSLYSIYSANEVYGKWLMVDANGEVAIPKIGRIKIGGLTQLQARERLVCEFKKWLVDPIIDIRVLNREVTVLGEVKSPGKLFLEKEENTLVDMIGRSGDFDLYANQKAVQVIRNINGQSHSLIVDLTRMDQFEQRNLQIKSGDVIYIPTRKGKLWDKRAGPSVLPIASAITTLAVLFKTFF